jgi:hypothetical protein
MGVRKIRRLMILFASATIVLGVIAITLAGTTVNQVLVSHGMITTSFNLGVYNDSACTLPMNSIDWGALVPGGSTTQTVYLKNIGTGIMTLSFSTDNWTPAGSNSYLSLSWNKEGTQLPIGQAVAATITLTVSSGINGISSFSNNIIITGTQL